MKFFSKKRIIIPAPRKEDPSTYTYEELYQEYWPILQKLYFYSIQDYEDAEDLAQIAMTKVWKYWKHLQWDKLAGAIGVIANNVKYDYLRDDIDLNKSFCVEDTFDIEYHDEGLLDPLRLLIIDRAADNLEEFTKILSARDARMFLDFYTTNMSPDEVCEKHDVPKKHMYVQLHRIREKLNAYTEELDIVPDGGWMYGVA